jgi:hypothetical protein
MRAMRAICLPIAGNPVANSPARSACGTGRNGSLNADLTVPIFLPTALPVNYTARNPRQGSLANKTDETDDGNTGKHIRRPEEVTCIEN